MYTATLTEAARKGLPTVLQIVHGFPPRELAGTELATARLTDSLRRRGWGCHVLAATRAPGLRQYELLEDGPGLTRLVNNMPFRPLGQERDLAVEAAVRRIIDRVAPDVVHLQHLAYLSSQLRFDRAAVGTLHDHWPWCPAGGTMLRAGGVPCPAPEPHICALCYAQHARLPGRVEHAAVGVAAGLARWVEPSSLHELWRQLPRGLRSRLRGSRSAAGTAQGAALRREALTATWNALDHIMAPSAFLARQAERFGLREVNVVPSGVSFSPVRKGGGPLVCLGSILPHKGVHHVVQAYRLAFADDQRAPGLTIHGDPNGDPSYASALDWPIAGPIAPAAVPDLLAGATALVMGSTWPENAPLVCLEARAAGCPVIAPRIGGIPELVQHGVDGLLYEAGDVTALARGLVQLTGSPTTMAVRRPPTEDEHAAQVEAIYISAMERQRSSAARRSDHE